MTSIAKRFHPPGFCFLPSGMGNNWHGFAGCGRRKLRDGFATRKPVTRLSRTFFRGLKNRAIEISNLRQIANELHVESRADPLEPVGVTRRKDGGSLLPLAPSAIVREQWIRATRPRQADFTALHNTGAGVPSDHLPVGTMNTSMGSGAPRNCRSWATGVSGLSAPQLALSISGV